MCYGFDLTGIFFLYAVFYLTIFVVYVLKQKTKRVIFTYVWYS